MPARAGTHLRLQYLDQLKGHEHDPDRPRRAPPGSITIASQPLSADNYVPKGFYLRCIEGKLWLRGCRSGFDHVSEADDRFVFV